MVDTASAATYNHATQKHVASFALMNRFDHPVWSPDYADQKIGTILITIHCNISCVKKRLEGR
jgi:hypothetical protein